jgi:uncharacterized protein YutE (UPF0331/DUF86 family)
MDQLILAEKIESLRRCIQRIEDKKPDNINFLIQDLDLQDILVLNLTRAVQLCVDIGSHIISDTNESPPQTMGEVFTTLHKLGTITPGTCQQLKRRLVLEISLCITMQPLIGKLFTRFAKIPWKIFAGLLRK